MRKQLSTLLLVCGILFGYSQQLEMMDVNLKWKPVTTEGLMDKVNGPNAKLTNCNPDTVLYGLLKATGLSAIRVDNVGLFSAYQYFDASPENPITVSGFTFYAWNIDGIPVTLNVDCSIWLAASDSLPNTAGAPLATTTVQVDTSFGGGQLSVLEKTATFSAPVTVTQPFHLMVENNNSSSIGLVYNDSQAGDGRMEWLAGGNIGGSLLKGYEIVLITQTMDTIQFDSDWLMQPFVSYSINTDYADPGCLAYDSNVELLNSSTPLQFNRMYNLFSFQSVFDMLPDSSALWSYGDGTEEYTRDATHSWPAGAASYDVTLYSLLAGYFQGCLDSLEKTITADSAANSDFSLIADNAMGFSVDNNSTANTYLWDFGDGNSSTDANPTHTYASQGTYTVTLVVIRCNQADTSTQEINIFNTGIQDDLLNSQVQVFPNPSTGIFNLNIDMEAAQEVEISVQNLMGQEVARLHPGMVRNAQMQMDLSALPKGVYLMNLHANERMITRKLLVE